MKKLKTLILADDSNPEWPSLPQMAWNQLVALSELIPITVATHVRNRPNLNRYGLGKAEIVYIDNEWVARPFYLLGECLRGGGEHFLSLAVAMRYFPYLAFEWQVWLRFKKEIDKGKYAQVHRYSPVSPALPSFMATRCPIPFIIGPVNGGLPWPKEHEKTCAKEGEKTSLLQMVKKILPYQKSSYRSASAVLAGFDHTFNQLSPYCEERLIDYPEIGIDAIFYRGIKRKQGSIVRACCVGRLVPCKRFDIAIKALPDLDSFLELEIVGDGPERESLEKLVKKMGLSNRVFFSGWCSEEKVRETFFDSDFFIFPSIREFGGNVVVEAMAAGCVPIVVDYGGPGSLVQEGVTGLKVPIGNDLKMIDDFIKVIQKCIRDRFMLKSLSEKAREVSLERYSWDAKAKFLTDVYQWVHGKRGKKPQFHQNCASIGTGMKLI